MNKLVNGIMMAGSFCMAALFTSQVYAASENPVTIKINNQAVSFPDTQPFIDENGRTQVPIRFVSEKLGFQVNWVREEGKIKITLKKNDKTIVLRQDDNIAWVNGQSVVLDTRVVIKEDRTFVPISFILHNNDINVLWDNNSHTVFITTDKLQPMIMQPSSTTSKTVDPVSTGTESPVSSQIGQDIVAYAKQFIGVPYVWGGTSPSGFDCSGYVQYVYDHFGKHLPRTAQQMYNAGTSVSALQPGDLVFFSTNSSGVSHVGLFLGNDQFVSATSSHGIKISSLNDPYYWGPRYIGAKRF